MLSFCEEARSFTKTFARGFKKNEVIHVKIAVRRYIIFRDIAFILIAQSLRHCSYIKGEFINLVDF